MERGDLDLWTGKEVARLLKLVESERRYYQELMSALPAPLAVLAEDRSIISANRAFRKAFGLDNQALGDKTIDQILPSERLIEKIREAHVRRVPPPNFFVEVNGRTLCVAVVPIHGLDEGRERETMLLVADVESQEPALDRNPAHILPEMPARTAALPALSADPPVVLWRADAATLTFTIVSSSVEALLEYPAQHWTGTPQFFTERIHPEDREAVLALYQAAIQRGGDAGAEYRAFAASGRLVWCRETIRVPSAAAAAAAESEIGQALLPAVSPGKSLIEGRGTITGVLTDITQRKQMEEQLLRAERTLAIHGMASSLAHDLNNPLMIITGYGEEVRDGLPKDDPMRADVEQILTATERISRLTGRLLEFIRGQADSPQPVDVARALLGLEKKIAAAAGEGVPVELQVASSAWAWAAPGQLEEAILAITSAMREDVLQSRLVITCTSEILSEHFSRATLRPGHYTCITIHRDGSAFDPKMRGAIFESFLAKEPEKAAGPALARAYGIVREWGGDVAFSSDLSQGSTFTIYLPHYEPESRITAAPGRPGAKQTREPLSKPDAEADRQTILVVDDEAGIRALVRKILRRENYVVLEAGSAEEALKIASRHVGRIDLLLTDVMLPGLTGRELAERMLSTRPELKVVYISGYTDDEILRRGAIAPGSRFLQKPFTLGALVGVVRAALGS